MTDAEAIQRLKNGDIGGLVWSPDGQQLAVNVLNTDQFTAKSTAALLNVQTCQVVPLPDLNGSIQSWVLP